MVQHIIAVFKSQMRSPLNEQQKKEVLECIISQFLVCAGNKNLQTRFEKKKGLE